MTGAAAESRRIRSLRPPRAAVDPWRPIDWLVEEELSPGDRRERALTIFLAGAECPFTCVFCDLWRHTFEGPTPRGAIPRQIEIALAEAAWAGHADLDRVKLYNASNYFHERAVPAADDAEVAALLAGFPEVTVECHPRFVGERCFAFAERLPGRLEVAMGLETAHPEVFGRLNKGMTLDDFDRAAERLAEGGVAVRVFVLVGVPFLPAEEQAEQTARTVAHALAQGADRVALIPVRGGNGEMERLEALGLFASPSLELLEESFDRALAVAGGGERVTVDLWDLDRFAACPACRAERVARLGRMNESGRPEPRIVCSACVAA